jgi:hypothetical protein
VALHKFTIGHESHGDQISTVFAQAHGAVFDKKIQRYLANFKSWGSSGLVIKANKDKHLREVRTCGCFALRAAAAAGYLSAVGHECGGEWPFRIEQCGLRRARRFVTDIAVRQQGQVSS